MAEPDYKNSPKNIWRHRWWKSAACRCRFLEMNPAACKVLYLPGPGDLDRRIAIKYGFLAHNLIGLDKDIDECKKHRRNGVTMIHGDAVEILGAWKPDSLPDVVLLDTCSVVSEPFSRLISVFSGGNFYNRRMVWGFNLVHGRDAALNKWKEDMQEAFIAPTGVKFCYNPKRRLFADPELLDGRDGKLHRGLVVSILIAEHFLSSVLKIDDMSERGHLRRAINAMDIEIDDYMSDGASQRMDSVIFNWAMYIQNKSTSKLIAPKRISGYNKKVSYKIAAGLASGTIQQNRKHP